MSRAAWCVVLLGLAAPASPAALQVLIVQGLGGEKTYEEQFTSQTGGLRTASGALTTPANVQVLSGAQATRENIESALHRLATAPADDRLVLYMVGHGSFDGDEYKFNIPGPDLTGARLAELLNALPMRDQLVVAGGSCSGALQDVLKNGTRIVITGTRSGTESNVTRFADEFVAALGNAEADIDKNGSISAQEAFDFAQRRVKDFYERDVRLATEHAVLRGERAPRFTLARLPGAAGEAPVADNPQQSAERSRITAALDALRLRKDELPAAEYDAQLEKLLLQLATLDVGTAPGSGP